MNPVNRIFIICIVSTILVPGCMTINRPSGNDKVDLSLNEGVKNLFFLTSDETAILQAVNKIRSENVTSGKLQPLKASTGLSLSAKKRAEELGRSNNPDITKDAKEDHLFKLARKFGEWKGGVAEIISYGYSGNDVVTQFMKSSPATAQKPYFMDDNFTVMGVGCTSAGRPSPICVIMLANEFHEVR